MSTPALPAPVPLHNGWSLWPVFELRGAGFSVDRLASLWAAAVVEALRAEDSAAEHAHGHRVRVLELCRTGRTAAQARPWVERVRRRERGITTGDAALDAALRALDAARDALEAAQARTQQAWQAQVLADERCLREVLDSSDFRRAVLLQNRGALQGGMEAWRRAPAGTDDHAARRGRVAVATYLQRYVTKNDTVGFMGPVGWGTFTAGVEPITQQAGNALVDAVAVHVEPWAAAALADARAADLEDALVPEVSPRILVQDGEVHGLAARSLRGTRPLPPGWAAVLARLDGRTTLGALRTEQALPRSVEAMRTQGALRVRLPVAAHRDPFGPTVNALRGLGAPGRPALFDVALVEDARQRVEDAFHDEEALALALAALDRDFARLTGTATTRNAGQSYGSRTLTYTNCRRSHALQVGAPVLDSVRAPLTLLLAAARWFTYAVARGFLREVHAIHRDAAARLGTPRVPMVEVYNRLVPLFANPPPAFIAQARAELARRWTRVLGLDGDNPPAGPVERTAAEIAGGVAREFAAPHPGLPGARHHSPDVLLARRDGGWQVVLGEIHAGVNTLAVLQAYDMHPDRALLRGLYRRDIPPGIFSELQHEDYALCAHDSLIDEGDWHLDTGSRYASWLPPERTVRLSALHLVLEDGCLRCTGAPGQWDVLQVLERMVRLNLVTEYHLPALLPHSPRVTVDGVVLMREGWRVERDELLPLLRADGLERFRAVTSLRRARGLPRRLFCRVPGEHKPFHVDLESPVSVDAFCRMAREAPQVSWSEMLPDTDEAWLVDGEGRRYVSEMRLVATDPEPWRPIPVPVEDAE